MANGTAIAVLYIGVDAYLYGVPARDMTADEWGAIAPELQQTAMALGLYQLVEKPKERGSATVPATKVTSGPTAQEEGN